MAAKFKYTLGINELTTTSLNLWRSLLAEFLGNFLLNFFACGACTQQPFKDGFAPDSVAIAFTFGLTIFMAIMAIGHISGGHINPAVTLGMLVAGKVSLIRAVFYIIVQCVGSIAGTGVLKVLINPNYNNLGHTSLHDTIEPFQGLGIEFFLGFVLVLTVFGVCDENKPDSRFMAPLAIGLTVTLGHLGTITYTGASMNPARTLGTAVMTGIWTNHWVYWVGPILGGIGAALLYTVGLKQSETLTITEKYRTTADEREMRKLGGGGDYP